MNPFIFMLYLLFILEKKILNEANDNDLKALHAFKEKKSYSTEQIYQATTSAATYISRRENLK